MAYSPQTPDEELVEHYRHTGDKLAVGELFKRHSLMCLAVCNKYLRDEEAAKDATMAVFEKLFDNLTTHTVKNFKSWLYSVCKNHCLMQLRKARLLVQVNVPDEDIESFFVKSDTFLHPTGIKEEFEYKLKVLEGAMAELNDKQRTCIDLFYLQQKSYNDICSETGYTTNEVKSHIQNAKRNLKNTLGRHGIVFCLTILTWIQHSA